MPIVSDVNFNVDIDFILKISGYGGERTAPKRFIETAEEMTELCLSLAEPRGVYDVYPLSGIDEGRILLDGVEFSGKVLTKVLKGSVEVAVFVFTLGSRVEEEVLKLSEKGSILSATTLDMVASLALVISSHELYREVLASISDLEDYDLTKSFGPGECNWDIREQKILFSLTDAQSIGVRLTDASLMLPKKSRSGIIGIGPKDEISDSAPCHFCDRKECPGREMVEIMGSIDESR